MPLLFALLVLPFAGSVVSALLHERNRTAIAWSAAAVPIAGLALLWWLAGHVFDGDEWLVRVPWIEPLGLNFSLRLDGLSLLFVGLIFGIGLLVILYAPLLPRARRSFSRFFCSCCWRSWAPCWAWCCRGNLLLTGVLGADQPHLVPADRLLDAPPDAREGARMALAVTGGGGLALLAGVLLLGNIVGSFEICERCCASGELIRAHPLYRRCAAAGPGRRPSPRARSSRSISGCRTPWRRPRRCRPTCIRRRW